MTQETLEKAIKWFESMGYHAEGDDCSSVYLYLGGFSVQLSTAEIEYRADLWDNELSRKD
jgi:hypothetical protein